MHTRTVHTTDALFQRPSTSGCTKSSIEKLSSRKEKDLCSSEQDRKKGDLSAVSSSRIPRVCVCILRLTTVPSDYKSVLALVVLSVCNDRVGLQNMKHM